MSYPVYGKKGLICHTLCMVRKGLYVSYPVYGKEGLICHTLCMVRKG